MTNHETFARFQDLVKSCSATEFWGPAAERQLHWFCIEHCAWLTRKSDVCWEGWHANTTKWIDVYDSWKPWLSCFHESQSSFVHWFYGGRTNAALNEVDRSVLQMHGETTAFLSDPTDGMSGRTSLTQLLVESILVASCLTQDYGLA